MSDLMKKKTISKEFLNQLGFEVTDDALACYVDGSNIVFVLQIIDEVGCNFSVTEKEETFPLNEMQLKLIKEKGFDDPEGFLIL